VELKSFKINAIRKCGDFLEVLILKGVMCFISPS
jgi:hypothetical protein